ncbi:hypothetical protein D3C80_1959510 [compost metagenome]
MIAGGVAEAYPGIVSVKAGISLSATHCATLSSCTQARKRAACTERSLPERCQSARLMQTPASPTRGLLHPASQLNQAPVTGAPGK